ncbi:MAG: acyl carrier protein [Bacilli bacterium]
MNNREVLIVLKDILMKKMCIPRVQQIAEDAYLEKDLFFDSIMIMEFVAHIELHFAIELNRETLSTFRTYTLLDCVTCIQKSIG